MHTMNQYFHPYITHLKDLRKNIQTDKENFILTNDCLLNVRLIGPSNVGLTDCFAMKLSGR